MVEIKPINGRYPYGAVSKTIPRCGHAPNMTKSPDTIIVNINIMIKCKRLAAFLIPVMGFQQMRKKVICTVSMVSYNADEAADIFGEFA
jgi:hypothetical protein